jgi:hypothetical protein
MDEPKVARVHSLFDRPESLARKAEESRTEAISVCMLALGFGIDWLSDVPSCKTLRTL